MPREIDEKYRLFSSARAVAGMTQAEWGALHLMSARTVMRIEQGRSDPLPSTYLDAAKHVFPIHRDLAYRLAIAGGSSLIALGLEKPPPPPASEAPQAVMEPPPPALPQPSRRHLVDSVVCVAAEAMNATPQAVRPALLAAIMRVKELGITIHEVEDELSPPPADLDLAHRLR